MALPVEDIVYPAVLKGQKNGLLDPKILVRIVEAGADVWLVEPAARNWVAMRSAAAAEGIILEVTSTVDSYRPYAVQQLVFNQRYSRVRIPRYITTRRCNGVLYYQRPDTASAACPGTSNHGLGIALDIKNATGARLAWLRANAHRFGFSWEVQSEPWHVRSVHGDKIPAATLAYEASFKSALEEIMRFKFDKSIPGADTTHTFVTDGLRYRMLPISYQLDNLHTAAGAGKIVTVTRSMIPAAWGFDQALASICGVLDEELGDSVPDSL